MRTTIVGCAVTALLVGGGTAVASSLITGKDIKNGTITRADIKKGTISESRLSNGVRTKLNKTVSGSPGQPGPQGPKGDKGDRGPQGPAGSDGGWFPKGFFITNKSVGLTASGADFGPYADGGTAGGSVLYTGLNGRKLSQITKLIYRASYSTDNNTDVAVPYLRVFLNDDNDDVIFSPNTQDPKDTTEDEPHTWNVLNGGVRYDDDAGTGPDSPWGAIVAVHGDDVISGIYVSAGFSAGQNLHAWLTDLTVNDKQFHFGA